MCYLWVPFQNFSQFFPAVWPALVNIIIRGVKSKEIKDPRRGKIKRKEKRKEKGKEKYLSRQLLQLDISFSCSSSVSLTLKS